MSIGAVSPVARYSWAEFTTSVSDLASKVWQAVSAFFSACGSLIAANPIVSGFLIGGAIAIPVGLYIYNRWHPVAPPVR